MHFFHFFKSKNALKIKLLHRGVGTLTAAMTAVGAACCDVSHLQCLDVVDIIISWVFVLNTGREQHQVFAESLGV